MHNPFRDLQRIEARRFTALPAKFRKRRRTVWSEPNRQGVAVDSFLEGLSFDRQGNLWCVDIPFGRIFRIDKKAEWTLAAQYDGWPNGLKIHKDGRIFIADNGDLYFTDQGQSGIADPTGRVWRLPLMRGGTPSKTGVAIQLSGGHAGPDGIEMDEEDGLAVCHLGIGVWRFDSNCLPTHLVHAGKTHRLMTNIAFKNRSLYITDSRNGEILTASMPFAGKKMFAHR